MKRSTTSFGYLRQLTSPTNTLLTIALLLACGALTGVARAETIAEAMLAAWAHHPQLAAARARHDAAAAKVEIARSGYRPRLTAAGELGAGRGQSRLASATPRRYDQQRHGGLDAGWNSGWRASINLEQPVFDGHSTSSAVAEAKAGDRLARERVRGAEQSVLFEAATVYAGLYRDRQIEALRLRNTEALNEEVEATWQRSRQGVATKTDIAQTMARRAQAIAELATAKANVKASTAAYLRVIGHQPGQLQPPADPEPLLPDTLEDALRLARAENPSTLIAIHQSLAARHAIDRHRARRMPKVHLRAGLETGRTFQHSVANQHGASIALRVVVPLYDGGETAARIKQARSIKAGFIEELRDTRARVHANVVAAWVRLAGGRERSKLERAAAISNQQALTGIRDEIRLGQKSTLDGLNAQRELVMSEERIANGDHDLLISAYALLASTGQLTTRLVDDWSRQAKPTGPIWSARVKRNTGRQLARTWRMRVRPAGSVVRSWSMALTKSD